MTTPVEVQTGEARKILPELIANLATTPVTLMRYTTPVADLVPHVPAEERANAARAAFREAVELAHACGNLETLQAMDDLGLSSLGEVETLLARIKAWPQEYGYGLDLSMLDWTAEKLPAIYHGNLDAIIAHLHLSKENFDSLHEAGADVVAWSNAAATLRRAAIHRKDSTGLFGEYEDDSSAGDALVATGLSPEEFTRRALELIGQGVALKDILDTFDDDAIPADVLAINRWMADTVRGLRKAGLSMADACALARRYTNSSTQMYQRLAALAECGITDLDELIAMHESTVKVALIYRARKDGLPAAEWKATLPKVSKYAYTGDGLLPWHLLVEAAEQDISLVAWDKLPDRKKTRSSYKYTPPGSWETCNAPFAWVYFDRIIEMAREGITPGYLLICWQAQQMNWISGTGDDFIAKVVDLRKRGLRMDVAKVVAASKPVFPKAADAYAMLSRLVDLGVTAAELDAQGDLVQGTADRVAHWRAMIPATRAFVDSLDDVDRELLAVTVTHIKEMDSWTRRRFGGKWVDEAVAALEKTPERLHPPYLYELLRQGADWARDTDVHPNPRQRMADLRTEFALYLKEQEKGVESAPSE